MIIMLDKTIDFIKEKRNIYPDIKIEQLRTPLTAHKAGDIKYILDNGAFSNFNEKKFSKMVEFSKYDEFCKYIVMPDVVSNAKKTFYNFYKYKNKYNLESHKCAYVVQDGINQDLLPSFDEIGCLFIGGTTKFKMSHTAFKLSKLAIENNIWVHVGRVNTPKRIDKWFNYCNSIDGSGISRFNHMFEKAVQSIRSNIKFNQNFLVIE